MTSPERPRRPILLAEAELDEARMTAWAEALGARMRSGDVLLLEGAMGSGKTTLTRALARGLGIERPGRVSSPTYTVCMVHRGPIALVHVDLFRLAELAVDPEQSAERSSSGSVGPGDHSRPIRSAAFESLGLEHDELPGPGQILVVEWADLWADPPPEHLLITLERALGSEHSRRIRVLAAGRRWSTSDLPELPASPKPA